ncbi:MAG TPA: rhodanese-like domain-containing protein [Bryobacteraceae bacterium]|nr:rhodanese-like domain-containing protein [Bryobacteraceae bacterium]
MNRRTAICTLFVGGTLFAAGTPPAKKLTDEELAKLLEKRENLFFLDVREPREIQQLGSIEGYVNIPLGQLESRLSEIPRDKLIITA